MKNLISKKNVLMILQFFCIQLIIISLGAGFVYPQQQKIIFRVGFSRNLFAEVNPEDANAAVTVYADVIRKKAQIELKTKIELIPTLYNSIEELRNALSSKTLDLIGMTSIEYLKLRTEAKLIPEFVGMTSESKYSQYLLVTNSKLNTSKLSDITNKRISIPSMDRHPIIEIWLSNLLAKYNLPPKEKFFEKMKIQDREAKAVYDVFFGTSDCAIVTRNTYNTLCEMNPQIAKSIKIIETSPELIPTVTASTEKSDPELLKIIKNISINLHQNIEGKNLLTIFKLSKISFLSEEELRSVKDLVDEYNRNKLKRKKPLESNKRAN